MFMTDTRLWNAYKIFFLKYPNYVFKPTVSQLKKEGLLENVDLAVLCKLVHSLFKDYYKILKIHNKE